MFNFTKGKTDLVNQRWRRTTCLKHQCYDVGCYPCLNVNHSNTEVSIPASTDFWLDDNDSDQDDITFDIDDITDYVDDVTDELYQLEGCSGGKCEVCFKVWKMKGKVLCDLFQIPTFFHTAYSVNTRSLKVHGLEF